MQMMQDLRKEIIKYVSYENNRTEELLSELEKRLYCPNKFSDEAKELIDLFYFDLKKIFSIAILKSIEIRHNLTAFEDGKRLNQFPYITYENLRRGGGGEKKIFGRSYAKSSKSKKFWDRFIGILIEHFPNVKFRIVGLGIDVQTPKNIFALITAGFLPYFFSINPKKIKKSCVHEEFDFDSLTAHIYNAVISVGTRELSSDASKFLAETIVSHITALYQDYTCPDTSAVNLLVIGSGIDFGNRVLARNATNAGKKVVLLMHGSGYGLLSERVFGPVGDHYKASHILGYGSYGEESIRRYANYFYPRQRSVLVRRSNSSDLKNKSTTQKFFKRIIYFPTTLSGGLYRYGPHRDTPDPLYLKWLEVLRSCFKDRFYIKIHPKDQFRKNESHDKVILGKLSHVVKDGDLLVFDYVSTALYEAIKTKASIIFIDIGLRNIRPEAVQMLSRRCHYIPKDGNLPDLDDLWEIFSHKVIDDGLANLVCGGKRSISRSRALIELLLAENV
jgi:hypothetical protein